MKKMIIFLVVIIALFATIAFINNTQNKQKAAENPYNKDNLKQSTIDQLNDPNYQNLILPEELAENLKNKEDKTVYFYSPECQHCQKTTPIVAPLAEEMGIDLVQYNLLNSTKATMTTLLKAPQQLFTSKTELNLSEL